MGSEGEVVFLLRHSALCPLLGIIIIVVAHIVASGATKRRGCVRNKRAPEEPPESRKVGDRGTSGSLEDEMCPLTAHLSPMAQDSLPRPLVLRGWRSGERAAEGQRPGEGPGTLTLSRKPSGTARQP